MGQGTSSCTTPGTPASAKGQEHGDGQPAATPTPGSRGSASRPSGRFSATSTTSKDAGERIELLGEIREMLEEMENLKRVKESLGFGSGPEGQAEGNQMGRDWARKRADRQKRDLELNRKSLEELRRMKSQLEAEYTKASKEQEEEMAKSFRKSTVRLGTRQDSIRFAHKSREFTSSSLASHDGPPPSTAASKGALQLALEEPLILLSPEFLCNDECATQDGLKWDLKWSNDPAGPKDEGMRRKVRLNTRDKVSKELGLSYFGEPACQARREPPHLKSTTLYVDGSRDAHVGVAPAGGPNLLGRYDVCCVKVCADLDRKWNFIKGNKPDFWVAHAAAINVGETVDAADFEDFQKIENSVATVLDEWKYVEAMGHIMDNIVAVCNKLGIQHMVLFPFGMGAFLRHLGRIDVNFTQDEEMLRLRRAVGARMVKSWAKAPKDLQVHLCLQFGSEEAQRNADAFLRALVGDNSLGVASSAVKDRVVVIPEGDSLDVASQLALRSDRVMLVNGANRQLLGNHWFNGRAKMAIDENLHRRSWRLSAISYLLNEFDGETEFYQRSKDALASRVKELGGKVVDLSSTSLSFSLW